MTQTSPNQEKPPSARSRYPGTRPFRDTAEDSALFFGRDKEAEQLYLRVLSVQLFVQFSKSGLGKTSLLQASLFPRLRRKPFLPVIVRFNVAEDSPTLAVTKAIQQACETERLELNQGRTDGLWELLSTTTIWREDLLLTLVLVFDQFEEVFTLRDATFRAELAAELGALSTGIAPERLSSNPSGAPDEVIARPNVKIVISLREDYLGELEEFSAAIPSLFHERLRLEPLTEEAAREAITRPAQLTPGAAEDTYGVPPFEFDPLALDSMLAYLKGSSGVIEPFQLQLLCRHAEVIAAGKTGTPGTLVRLTPADFDGSKAFDSVLKNFYRDALLTLDGPQRRRAEVLCEEGLLDPAGHRLMMEEQQIQTEFGITTRSLATLSMARLLRRERRLESAFYEISHDRLAESIMHSKRFRLPRKVRRRLWSAAVVALGIAVVVSVWIISLHRERQKTDDLLGFLLGNFLEDVRDIGRSTMLEDVRVRVDHLGSQRAALNRGLALRNQGDLERAHGSISKSITLFTRALDEFEHSDGDNGVGRESARAHDRLVDALADEGQLSQALSNSDEAVKAWRQVVAKTSPAATEDCTGLADSLASAASLRNRTGDATRALADVESSVQITSNLLFGSQPGQPECGGVVGKAAPYPNAKILEVASSATSVRSQILGDEEDFDGTAALAIESRILNPASISARENALNAQAWRGNAHLDTPQSALDDYSVVLTEFEALRRWDPDNRLWQRQRAAAQLVLSEGILKCNESKTKDCKTAPSLEDAEALSLEAIATLRALTQLDAANVSWQYDLAWALQDHASVLAKLGREAESLAMLQRVEPIVSAYKGDLANADAASKMGGFLTQKSQTLAALGRLPEAKESSQRAIDIYAALMTAHQDNPTYVYYLSLARQNLAEILRKAGDSTGVAAADRETKQLDEKYDALTRARQAKDQTLKTASIGHINEGAKIFHRGSYREALVEFEAAEPLAREYVDLRPGDYDGYENLRNVYDWVQLTQEKLDRTKERLAPLKASMNAAQIAALLAPEAKQTNANKHLLDARQNLDMFVFENKTLGDASIMVEEEIAVADRLVLQDKRNADYLWRLGNAECGLGMVRRENHNEPGWEEAIRSGLIQFQKGAEVDAKGTHSLVQLGYWRKYLGDQLETDGRKAESLAEYHLSLKAYQAAAARKPVDDEDAQTAQTGIHELAELGIH
jgi:hypothetical protein